MMSGKLIPDIRLVLRDVLPSSAYNTIRTLCHESRFYKSWITAFILGMKFIFQRTRLPSILLFSGSAAPGDSLLCSAVLRESRRRGATNLVMISNHSELFTGNADIEYIWSAGKGYDIDYSIVSAHVRFAWLCRSKFRTMKYAPLIEADRSESPSRHIVADMCANAGIRGAVSIRTYLYLTEREKEAAKWAAGQLIIQSSGMGGRWTMQNKQWYADRFQGVVDALCNEIQFIQLGSPSDPALHGVTELRGSTSIREAAAILYNARMYVGNVGFLMHLARAVECPSVIVYGGREAPWQSGYVCNANIYSPVPCAPCWRWNSCDFDRKCMTEINAVDVVSAIREMLKKERNPLAVETIVI
jgi:hypothetical protein